MTTPLTSAIDRIGHALHETWGRNRAIALPAMPGAAEALVALGAAGAPDAVTLCVCASLDALDRLHRDTATLAPFAEATVHYLPAREDAGDADLELAGYRLGTLSLLRGPRPPGRHIVVTEIRALMQAAPAPAQLAASTQVLEPGCPVALERLTLDLEAAGYSFTERVTAKGEASVRGGLLDVWPPTAPWPVRVELFGPDIDSLRTFDPSTQRTVEHIERLMLTRAGEHACIEASPDGHVRATALDYLPAACVIVQVGAGAIAAATERIYARAQSEPDHEPVVDPGVVHARFRRLHGIAIDPDGAAEWPDGFPALEVLPALCRVPFTPEQPDRMEQARQRMIEELDRQARAERRTVRVFFDTDGALQHFRSALTPARRKRFAPCTGPLSEGFQSASLALVVVTEPDLYGKRKTLTERYDPAARRRRAPRYAGERVSDLADLEHGDLIVHVEHGIGRYLGVQAITFNDQPQEVIAIDYADDQKLYVPMGHSHLLSRYVGVAGQAVRLHQLGGKRWNREKQAAESAVMDLAASLLDVQAARNLLAGFAFPVDTPWQGEFENAFPFQETIDQTRVIAEVKQDMEATRPMDRLVCGDAGYGKTEVAMRAAFKAVAAGRQVAVLVPTTVLAQQHYRTFTERMSGYPVRIEVISRLVTAARRRDIMTDTRAGTVDIVIGTHALLHPAMRFAALGLVIIDEEQRFGVKHKERLKQMKQLVDVLTLSATPIPRTLYLSLTGTRDMSLLRTPPRERMAVETIVAKDDDDTIRRAIRRELERGGQVFFLYNRVRTIARMELRLRELVPEATIAVAHGQMPAAELTAVMRRFIDGHADILLCTTIIESGMDIPRANTILIDRADRFGLADLYQLRGRVGRSSHKAYAYMLLPVHGYIDADARARIAAIRKFSNLGAGFNLAMRDLELRGAGNILGAAQSGHIGAVGFGLYCRLLQRAIAQRKGEPLPRLAETELELDFLSLAPDAAGEAVTACIPFTYIEDEGERVALYRRMAETVTLADVAAVTDEIRDRFGPLPPPLNRVLQLCRIRVLAAERGITRIATREDRLALLRQGDYLTHDGRLPPITGQTPDAKLDAVEQLVTAVPPLAPDEPPSPRRSSSAAPTKPRTLRLH